jgi:preprotein translocase subunit SecY
VKKLFKTLKNIWSIEELRSKILYTLLLIFIYRVGTHVVLPGIDPTKLEQLGQSASGGILGLIDTFAGGAFAQASIFALGIMPYIWVSCLISLHRSLCS